MHGDSLRVDPDIEHEAANVKLGTSGNRAANALNRLANDQHQQSQPATARVSIPAPQASPAQPMQAPVEAPPAQSPAQETRSELPRRII